MLVARSELEDNTGRKLLDELERINNQIDQQVQALSSQTAQDLAAFQHRIESTFLAFGECVIVSTTNKGTDDEEIDEVKVSDQFKALSTILKEEVKNCNELFSELQKVTNELITLRDEVSGTNTQSGYAAEVKQLNEEYVGKRHAVISELKRDLNDLYREAKEGEKVQA